MFLISKLVGYLTDPPTVFLALLVLGLLLSLSHRRRRLGQGVVCAVVTLILVLSVVPLDTWILTRLEERFPPPSPLPEHVNGIIVLGGAINPEVSAARGQVSIGAAATRLSSLVPLAVRHPEARLIYSGGAGNPFEQELKEADYASAFYKDIGFDIDRIVFERQSRNTRENATLGKEAMAPKPGETWLLITSAWHMPRAVGCFRAAGWPVIAYPTDYLTTGIEKPWWRDLRFSPARGFNGLNLVLHEVVGLISYRLMGWTNELYPGP